MKPTNFIAEHYKTKVEGNELKRFEEIIDLVDGDEVALRLLEGLLEKAERYFSSVVKMESRLKMERFRLDPDQLRELTENLDQNRHMAHNALLSDLHILNRYLFKEFGKQVPVGGIFSESPEAIRDRAAVGDWAGRLLYALYDSRKR